MKIIRLISELKLKYVLIICISYFLFACQNRNNNLDSHETCTLTIICDSTFNQNLFYDSNLFTKDDTIRIQKIKFDTLNKTITYKWTNLKKEQYHFENFSVFQQKNMVSFYLNRDTTLRIRNKFKHKLIKIIPKASLLKSDTIYFAFQTCGCSYGIFIYSLTKNNGKYRLKSANIHYGGSPIDKEVSAEIINDLFKIQRYCRNHKFHSYISTRAYQFMLLSNNKVFYFDDKYSADVELFYRFRMKYIYNKLTR